MRLFRRSRQVFVLTGWTACADDISYGPSVFSEFDKARSKARELDQTSPDWWFQDRPGRALRWKDPKDHARGFWEIKTAGVE
jgi:hypothetical protein